MTSVACSIGKFAPFLLFLACAPGRRDRHYPRPTAEPAAVETADGLAEDIQADIDALAWRAADAKLTRLLAETDGVIRSMPDESGDRTSGKLGEYRSGLDSLMARVARRERLGALEAANGLSRVLAATAQGYSTPVPVSVTLLDVAGRDVIYQSEGGRWSEASGSAGELRSAYAAVRAHVARANASLDGHMRQSLDEIDARISVQDTAGARAAANLLLADVDLIEQTYTSREQVPAAKEG